MNTRTGQGYGSYEPPKQEKRHPLTRQDTRELYRTACDYPDREVELVGRVLLDYGLRVGELEHATKNWVDKEYKRAADAKLWRINIPRVEYCYGGKGGEGGHQNSGGVNLHETNNPCSNCVGRSWDEKVNGSTENQSGWITEQEAVNYDWAPKKRRSATKVWQFPAIDEMAETARLLKEFLSAQKHGQWPHAQNGIRTRLDKLVDVADLELPDRVHDKVVPHGLRHTYGCRLVEASIGEGAAMKQMRHQNAEIFRWYADVRDSRVISALNDAVSENDKLLHK